MLLRDRDGREFELSIVGYEFPNTREDWLLVDVRMKDDKGERKKRDPCLAVEEAGELADWLDEIARAETHIGSGMPNLAEPNLQIDVIKTARTEIELRVSFIFESKEAPPFFDHVDLVIERGDLRRAVSELRKELEAYRPREAEPDQEQYLGGVTSFYIERFSKITGLKSGYGVYATDRRIIGVSYARKAIRPFIPGILLTALWVASLIVALLISFRSGSDEVPSAPYVFALSLVALAFLLIGFYRVERIVQRDTPTSLAELSGRKIDLEVRKEEVADIRVNRGFPGGVIIVLLKSGPKVKFYAYRKKKLVELAELLRKFWLGEQKQRSRTRASQPSQQFS